MCFSGWFVYIETNYPTLNRDKARLVTPYVSASENCLTFYYHMYGDHVNTLNVFVRSGSDKKKLIWSLSKNQGDAWRMAQVSLTGKNAMKQVRHSAISFQRPKLLQMRNEQLDTFSISSFVSTNYNS